MIFVVWGESLRKRGRRWEPKWLGDIDAHSGSRAPHSCRALAGN
jgi:hypothetical protein